MVVGVDGSRAFLRERTGTENYSYQLLRNLAKIDRINQYIVYVKPKTISSTIAPFIVEFPDNFQFKEIPWFRLWTQGGLALQTFKDKLDVLFVPAHTLPLFRKPGLKTVVTVHDLGSEYLPSMHQLKQRLYLGFMQNFQLKTATKIIAVSKATKEDLVKRVAMSPKKISVVYEGFDQDLFKPVKDDLLVSILRQYDLEMGKYFLFVGTVQPRKNLERLIKAYAKVVAKSGSDFATPVLVVAGSKGWLSEEIYNLPKKLGIEERVKFLGYVPDEDLPALYSGAVALIFPSLFEGFGLPILEAQACGCPVLTSNVSSMPEVGGKGAILVNPYSEDDIVRGIREVGEIRAKLVKAGFENVKRFSWEKCAKETLEVLENI